MSKQPAVFSDQIRQAMADSGITRYRIAQDTGLNEAALGKFFHGERGMSLESIDILADYLHLEVVVRKTKNPRRR